MNDLDLAIRRAFDELIDAAPPPPTGPGSLTARPSGERPAPRRAFAVAASVVAVAAAGLLALALVDRGDDRLEPADVVPPTTVDTPSPATTTIPVTTPSTAPATTTEQTDPPTTTPATTPPPSTGEYVIVPGLPMPEVTEPVPAAGETFDGVYFAYLHEGPLPDDPSQLRFDLFQAFSGAACADRFGVDAANVCTPIGLDVTAPTAQLDLTVTEVPVSVRSLGSDESYGISGIELVALVTGATPGPSAPDGFAYSGGFGFLLSFVDGTLTRIDQPAALG